MTLEYATIIVSKELMKLRDYGYHVKETQSKSTNSKYYEISRNSTSLIFRISDHKGKTSIITLRVDLDCTENTIKNFVANRIKDFDRRCMKDVLGIRHGRI